MNGYFLSYTEIGIPSEWRMKHSESKNWKKTCALKTIFGIVISSAKKILTRH